MQWVLNIHQGLCTEKIFASGSVCGSLFMQLIMLAVASPFIKMIQGRQVLCITPLLCFDSVGDVYHLFIKCLKPFDRFN